MWGNKHKLHHSGFRQDIRKILSLKRVDQHSTRICREVVEWPFLEVFKNVWMWCWETQFIGGLGSAMFTGELEDLKYLFQSKWFYYKNKIQNKKKTTTNQTKHPSSLVISFTLLSILKVPHTFHCAAAFRIFFFSPRTDGAF